MEIKRERKTKSEIYKCIKGEGVREESRGEKKERQKSAIWAECLKYWKQWNKGMRRSGSQLCKDSIILSL